MHVILEKYKRRWNCGGGKEEKWMEYLPQAKQQVTNREAWLEITSWVRVARNNKEKR